MTKTSLGERLRGAREERGLSLYEASRQTRIRVDFLDFLEKDNFRFMTGRAYIRGLLTTYSRWLGLDSEALAAEFDQHIGPSVGPTMRQIVKEPAQKPIKRRPHWMIAAASAAAILVVLSLVGLMKPAGPENVAEAPTNEEAALPSEPSSPESKDVASAPTAIAGVQVTIEVIGERSWMQIAPAGGGEALFEGNLFNGDTRTFADDEAIKVTLGNLGAVRVTVNGRRLGTPGAEGEVGTFIFRPDTSVFTRG